MALSTSSALDPASESPHVIIKSLDEETCQRVSSQASVHPCLFASEGVIKRGVNWGIGIMGLVKLMERTRHQFLEPKNPTQEEYEFR